MAAAGVPAEVVQLMRAHRSTVLFQQITTADVLAALSGRTGTVTQVDYRQQPVLASYAPLAIPDLRWGIVAKLDTAEALAPALALRRVLVATGAGVAALVGAVAVLLARSLPAPSRPLIAGMGTLGWADLARGSGNRWAPSSRRSRPGTPPARPPPACGWRTCSVTGASAAARWSTRSRTGARSRFSSRARSCARGRAAWEASSAPRTISRI